MAVAFVTHPHCRLHQMGDAHPEQPARLGAIEDELHRRGIFDLMPNREAPRASVEQSPGSPALDAFRPQLILISAGFDAHAADDMSQLRLTTEDYGWVTDVACAMALRHAQGRIVSTLEGGYELRSLAASAAKHVERLVMS
ncbi:MAG: hypothetical protein ACR2I8_10745 [Steroidobacteraceae bacterium]